MRITRVYVDLALSEGLRVELAEKTCHYLIQVLRLKSGAQLILFNGDGYEYTAELFQKSKHSATALTGKRSNREVMPGLQIHLALGLSKGDRFDFAIQKATELGVTSISPLLTERTAVKLSRDRLEKKASHWQGVITSACEQSGRCYLPTLNPVLYLNDWIQQQSNTLAIILDPESSTSLKELSPGSCLTFLVGPEGGFSRSEINLAQQHHFQTARLGKHVLRTETAPVAAIAAAQTLWGDFQ